MENSSAKDLSRCYPGEGAAKLTTAIGDAGNGLSVCKSLVELRNFSLDAIASSLASLHNPYSFKVALPETPLAHRQQLGLS